MDIMSEIDKDYLYGYMSGADDDNASDGAWWCMLQEAAAACRGVEFDDAFEDVHGYIAYCDSDDGRRILGLPPKVSNDG